MESFLNALILLIAALHFWILTLEMFLWTKPVGLRMFRLPLERAQSTAVLAANQGLYNGFLGAGLVFSVITPDPAVRIAFRLFFLSCVAIAGLYGAKTVSSRILWIQAVPAGITLALVITLGQGAGF